MNNPNLLVQRTDADAKLPTKGSEQSAGWDIYCLASVDIPAGRRATLPTGIAFGIPAGWYGRIAPRSGLANKYGADILAGAVAVDYRKLRKLSDKDSAIHFTHENDYRWLTQWLAERDQPPIGKTCPKNWSTAPCRTP